MALQLTADLLLGIGALIVATIAIVMFLRATGGVHREDKPRKGAATERVVEPIRLDLESNTGYIQVPKVSTITKRSQVEEARSKIRTLTLQQEILGMVMKRLFEAEDEGEISREERERLAGNYEAEMRDVKEELHKAELIVSLNELEEIRTSILDQFQETLTDTQQKIDLIIKELGIHEPSITKKEPEPIKTPPKRTRRPRPKPVSDAVPDKELKEKEEPEVAEEEDEEEETTRGGTVEDRLQKLKEDVLKELEELDRLELEA